MLSIGKLAGGGEDYYLEAVAAGLDDYYLGAGEAPGVWLGGRRPRPDRQGSAGRSARGPRRP